MAQGGAPVRPRRDIEAPGVPSVTGQVGAPAAGATALDATWPAVGRATYHGCRLAGATKTSWPYLAYLARGGQRSGDGPRGRTLANPDGVSVCCLMTVVRPSVVATWSSRQVMPEGQHYRRAGACGHYERTLQ